MKVLIAILLGLLSNIVYGQQKIYVSENLHLIKLSERAYIHTSYFESEDWGRFPSNGLILVDSSKAFLFDTPMTDSVTHQLLSFITDSLKAELIGFVPNHWHNDCTEGLDILNNMGIPSYANSLTNEILKSKDLTLAANTFEDSLFLDIGKLPIECRYFGKAHTADNIVVWIPTEKILFAGCMLKSASSKSLGNTSDANLTEWPLTLRKVKNAYPKAEVVIPGHGRWGDLGLIDHTLSLLEQK